MGPPSRSTVGRKPVPLLAFRERRRLPAEGAEFFHTQIESGGIDATENAGTRALGRGYALTVAAGLRPRYRTSGTWMHSAAHVGHRGLSIGDANRGRWLESRRR